MTVKFVYDNWTGREAARRKIKDGQLELRRYREQKSGRTAYELWFLTPEGAAWNSFCTWGGDRDKQAKTTKNVLEKLYHAIGSADGFYRARHTFFNNGKE